MPLGIVHECIVHECMCLLLQHDIIVHVHNCIKGFSRQWFTVFRSMFYWLLFICWQQINKLLFSSVHIDSLARRGRNRPAAVRPTGLTWPWPAPFIVSFVLTKRLCCLGALLKMYKQENVVQTTEAECCKHGNKYLIVWLAQIKKGCMNTKQKCVYMHRNVCDVNYRRVHFGVLLWRKGS